MTGGLSTPLWLWSSNLVNKHCSGSVTVYRHCDHTHFIVENVFGINELWLCYYCYRLYYQYIPEGKEYPVLCRSIGNEERGWMKTILRNVRGQFGKEEILLDWNEIAEKIGGFSFLICVTIPLRFLSTYVELMEFIILLYQLFGPSKRQKQMYILLKGA